MATTNYFLDGKQISNLEARSLMIKNFRIQQIRKCTMYEFIEQLAEKGNQKAVEFLKHLQIK